MIPGQLPPLGTLRAFEAVARLGSVVRAAAELHVTPGAVSRQVRQLEEALGLLLFERRNRALHLTPAGQALQEACADALGTLAQAVARLRATAQPAPLVLSCEPTLAMRWLIPRLPALQADLPTLRMHLLTAGGPVDFAADRVDVALRRNDFAWGSHGFAEPLAPEWMAPVCTEPVAQALRRQGGLGAGVPLLHTRTRPQAWARWSAASGQPLPRARTHARGLAAQRFEHFYLSLQAAGAGLGVAMASAYMVVDDVRAGRLVAPFGFVDDGTGYVLLSPRPLAADARQQALLAWLRAQMRASLQGLGLNPAPGPS